jgi:ABC-type antimicrobial peptide transport system permease subunit
VGIYGMMAFLVRQRSREVGIRLALGANPSRLVRALTRESLWWTVTGVIVGLVLSLAVTSVVLKRILYGVTPTDPAVFIAIPAFLLLVGYLAGRVPASAASRVEPLRAMRDD